VFANEWRAELGDVPVGRGATPDRAFDDLARRLEAIRPAHTMEPRGEFSGAMWTYEVR